MTSMTCGRSLVAWLARSLRRMLPTGALRGIVLGHGRDAGSAGGLHALRALIAAMRRVAFDREALERRAAVTLARDGFARRRRRSFRVSASAPRLERCGWPGRLWRLRPEGAGAGMPR